MIADHYFPQTAGLTAFYRDVATVPCAHCNRPLPRHEATIDHIVPRSEGGTRALVNVAVACASCNNRRRSRDFWEFRDEMEPTREFRRRARLGPLKATIETLAMRPAKRRVRHR